MHTVTGIGGSNPPLSAKSTQFEPKRNKLSAFSIFAVFAQFSQVAFIQLHFGRRVRRSIVEDINAIVKKHHAVYERVEKLVLFFVVFVLLFSEVSQERLYFFVIELLYLSRLFNRNLAFELVVLLFQ